METFEEGEGGASKSLVQKLGVMSGQLGLQVQQMFPTQCFWEASASPFLTCASFTLLNYINTTCALYRMLAGYMCI